MVKFHLKLFAKKTIYIYIVDKFNLMEGKRMGNGSFSQFVKYVSMNVAGMIGLSCYILADTFFISQGIGPDGLTALNIALPVFNIMNGAGLMIGMGGAARFSILSASGDRKKGDVVFTSCFLLAAIVSALLVFIGLFFSRGLSQLLGADETILPMTEIYLKVMLLFSPLFMFNNLLICFVRNDGSPNLAMASMIIGSVANIIMDYIFIFPMGMGMLGAIAATAMAPGISLILILFRTLRGKNSFGFAFSLGMIKRWFDVASLGISSFITEFSSGIVIMIFNFLILGLMGNTGVAAYGIVANIALVVTAVFTGISQGIQPLVSRSKGEGDNLAAERLYRYGIVCGVLTAAAVCLAVFLFAEEISGVFNPEGLRELELCASQGLRLYFPGFIFAGVNIITAVFFGAWDKPAPSFIISALRGFVVIIPTAFIMAYLFNMTGVWLAFPVCEALVMAVSVFYKFKYAER